MMTPEEAQWLLDKCHQPDTDLPHIMDGKDTADAVETLAAMTYEYAVQYQDFTGEWDYSEASPWKLTAEEVSVEEQTLQLTGFTTRIVRRLVSETEEVQP
ncbi:hypothetical protein ACMXZU_04420 [Corynebacterium striatum]